MRFLHVQFGHDALTLDFQLRSTDLAQRWVKKVRAAQRLKYPIDQPDRFYGFGTLAEDTQHAIDHINQQIDIINQYQLIIDRRMTDVNDQDTLNYLHHVFENYHGLLDQQHHEFWQQAPEPVRQALARLNTAVHRCESVSRNHARRAVITYYGLPKKHSLVDHDYDLIERDWKFGTVHLCYVEIGKTLRDLSQDDDQYISDEAFKPWHHYSADFVIQFNHSDPYSMQHQENLMWKYYEQHGDFFQSRGFDRQHPALKMGIFPVADLITDLDQSIIVERLRSRQHVNRVWFS
jgi:hypothetical protein